MPDDDHILFYGRAHPEYRWLSNFYFASFEVEGREYQTVEHFYQASKANNDFDHERVRVADGPKMAKHLGYKIMIKQDWDDVRFGAMLVGLFAKFRQNPKLRAQLLATGDAQLHEDSPTDMYWGWVQGKGLDRLGRALIHVRKILKDEG